MKKLLFLLLLSNQLLAQDTTKITELTRVLVVGIRADSKTPVTQKTLGDTSIQSTYQGQEVPVLLSSQPSMNSSTDGGHAQGYTYLTLRGMNQSRINVTLNGVGLNEPEDAGVYTSNYPSFINAIHSIQIQRGVGTSSNGSASFGGSINLQTKSGLIRGSEVQIGIGSYNTKRFNTSISSGLTNKNFAFFANFGAMSTDGFRYNSGSSGGSVLFSLGHYGSKQITKFTLFSGNSTNQMAWEATDEETLKKDYRTNQRGKDAKDVFDQLHLQLNNISIINKNLKVSQTLYYNHLDGMYDVYNYKDIKVNGYYANENQHSNWLGYIGQMNLKAGNLRVTLGLSASTYKRQHNGYEMDTTHTKYSYSNYGIRRELSGFIKFNYDVDNISYYLDLQQRYNDFTYVGSVPLDKQKWSFFNPKFGVKAFVNDNLNIYYMFGISHREPTRSVMFNNNLYLVDFNNVKPEKVLDYEIGLNITTTKLTLQANVFAMFFNNEIIPAGKLGSNSLPVMINVDNSLRCGFEVDLDLKVTKLITYSVNAIASRNRFGNDQKTHPFTPSLILNQTGELNYNNISFGLNTTTLSDSYMDIENRFTSSGYTILGLNTSYTLNRYKLSIQANNLLNYKYYNNGYVIGNTKYFYPNALANYYITLRVKL